MSEFQGYQSFDVLRQRAVSEVTETVLEDIAATTNNEDATELSLWLAQYTGNETAFARLERELLPDPGEIAVKVVIDYETQDDKPYTEYIDALCAYPTTHRLRTAFRIAPKLEGYQLAEAYVTLNQTLSGLDAQDEVDTASLPDATEVLAGAVDAADRHLKTYETDNSLSGYSYFNHRAMKVLMYAGAIQNDITQAIRVADWLWKEDNFSDFFTFQAIDTLEISQDPVFKGQLTDLALRQITNRRRTRLIGVDTSLRLLPYLDETQSEALLHTLATSKQLLGSPMDDQYLLDLAENRGWLKPRQISRRQAKIQKKIVEWDTSGYREKGNDQRADRLLELGYTGDVLVSDATFGVTSDEAPAQLTDEQRLQAICRLLGYTRKGIIADDPGIVSTLRDNITEGELRFKANVALIGQRDSRAIHEATDYLLDHEPWREKTPYIPKRPDLGFSRDNKLASYLIALKKTETQ